MTSARVPISADAEAWQRIAAIVAARRSELGIRQADAVARSAGRVSLPVWSILENARQKNGRMDRETLRGASLALGWPEHYLEQQIDEPVTAPGGRSPGATARLEALEVRMGNLETQVRRLVEQLVATDQQHRSSSASV